MAQPPASTAAADELRKQLSRYDAYQADVKANGVETATIKAVLADWIDELGKCWCGDWQQRACHKGGRLGSKCTNDRCGSYMMEEYDQAAQEKYDKWFKNSDFERVMCFEDTATKELYYEGRKAPYWRL